MSDSELPPASPAPARPQEGQPSEHHKEEATIVLAAIDTSTLTNRVVDLAARISRRTWQNAQLHLLHVVRSSRLDRPAQTGIHSEELLAEASEYLEYHVRIARRQCPAPVTGHLAQGDPAEEILRRARSLGADLVVVGTHDTVGLERFLLGSVAAKVARKAPCPVLVVRPKQRAYTKVS
jgi:nucleotide-binding universal stress UspA family protein